MQWNEKSIALIKVRLVCGDCYEEIKARNVLGAEGSQSAQVTSSLPLCEALPRLPSRLPERASAAAFRSSDDAIRHHIAGYKSRPSCSGPPATILTKVYRNDEPVGEL